jgi:hypothetical protein
MQLPPIFRSVWSRGSIRLGIGGAFLLLAWDVGFTGSYVASLLLSPILFLACVLKSSAERAGWRMILVSLAIPVLTLGLVVANSEIQIRLAKRNAARVIAACEQFRAANGRFPKSLEELPPRYLPYVPRAKYSLAHGEFSYFNYGKAMLVWCVVPPFERKIYDFETQRWNDIE